MYRWEPLERSFFPAFAAIMLDSGSECEALSNSLYGTGFNSTPKAKSLKFRRECPTSDLDLIKIKCGGDLDDEGVL